VFGYLSVRSNDPVWMASVTESEWLDPAAPMEVGRRGRMVLKAMGRREFLDEVTEYEPGRRIAHHSVAGPMQIRTACIAEPAGTGCRATVVYEPLRLPGGVLRRLTAPLTATIVRRNFRADLARLKDILEAEARVARYGRARIRGGAVEFRVLGALEVVAGGKSLDLGPPRQRMLLGLLLLRAGEVVSYDRLVEQLWDDDPPGTARHTLQGYVHRLRRALGPDAWRLQTRPPGYRLKVSAGELDAEQFDELAGQGRRALVRGDPRAAAELLAAALDLWRGPLLADSARWPPWNPNAPGRRRCA
jgi:Transcriptional regulatory protein, C terminal/Bacterial transcriptional activator domain/Polyketide cyclase / dehydrase and lipid transport